MDEPIGIPKEEVWAFYSVEQKILRVGDDNDGRFATRIIKLRDSNPVLFERLSGVCARLEFIERLRFTLTLTVDKDDTYAAKYQRDRLIVYMTATCLDVVAGKDKEYKLFPDWLRKLLKSSEKNINPNIQDLINELVIANSEPEVVNILKSKLQALKDDYYQFHGTHKAFLQLFQQADTWLSNWLSQTYIILMNGHFLDESGRDDFAQWVKLSSQEKCKKIAEYIFGLRNSYTHTVDQAPTAEDNWGSFGTNIQGKNYRFYTIHKNGNLNSPVETSVGLSRDLSESDVIKFIIIAELRKWLDIKDDETLIQKYLDRIRYQQKGYSFLSELQSNYQHIQEWCVTNTLGHMGNYGDFKYYPISELRDVSAKEFWELHKNMHPNMTVSLCNIESYISGLERINEKIKNFNNAYAENRSKIEISDVKQLIHEIVSSHYTTQFTHCLMDIQRDFFRYLDAPYY